MSTDLLCTLVEVDALGYFGRSYTWWPIKKGPRGGDRARTPKRGTSIHEFRTFAVYMSNLFTITETQIILYIFLCLFYFQPNWKISGFSHFSLMY